MVLVGTLVFNHRHMLLLWLKQASVVMLLPAAMSFCKQRPMCALVVAMMGGASGGAPHRGGVGEKTQEEGGGSTTFVTDCLPD
jgi:hypothetical protein